MHGGLVLIGAPDADSLETDTGRAHLFTRSGRLLQSFDPTPTTFCAAAGADVALARERVETELVEPARRCADTVGVACHHRP
jgi:hypothetical protein